MDFLQVLIMAALQGVIEFLPMSSAGHLVIIEHLLKMDVETGMLLTVMLHLGTLLAIFVVFKNDITRLVLELHNIVADIVKNAEILLHNKRRNDAKRYLKVFSNNHRKFAVMIIVSTIPTIIMGALLQGRFKRMHGSLLATGTGLLITAVFLLVVNFTKQGEKRPLDINYKTALLIGALQGLAVLPGVSRAGVTLAACLLCGFTCKFAIKYSFILAIPTIIGANIMTLATMPKGNFSGMEILYCIVGIIIAALVGLACAKAALSLIRKEWLKYFAGYSLIIGIFTIVYNFV